MVSVKIKQAFAFWEVTLDDADLDVARTVHPGSPLYERALWARARRQDRSVIPEVLRKIPESPEYWLQIGRYLWSDALTEALDPLLEQIAEEQGEGYSNLEYAVAEALKHLEPRRVVAMLSPRWAKLMAKPLMVQTMLLSTAPEAASLAREALTLSENPGALLKHFVMNATTDSNGKFGLSVPAQLHNLKPYLDLFSDDDIKLLWRTCTKKGWLAFCTQDLEFRMQKISNRHEYLPDDPVATGDLDRAMAGELIYQYHWFEQQLERGAARDKVVAAMLDWLSRRDEESALVIVGSIMSRVTTRREYQLFEVAVGQRTDSASSVKEVCFDVFSRSLV